MRSVAIKRNGIVKLESQNSFSHKGGRVSLAYQDKKARSKLGDTGQPTYRHSRNRLRCQTAFSYLRMKTMAVERLHFTCKSLVFIFDFLPLNYYITGIGPSCAVSLFVCLNSRLIQFKQKRLHYAFQELRHLNLVLQADLFVLFHHLLTQHILQNILLYAY